MKQEVLIFSLGVIIIILSTVSIVASVALSLQIKGNRSVGEENQRLIRYVVCTISVPATSRTLIDIDKCRTENGVR